MQQAGTYLRETLVQVQPRVFFFREMMMMNNKEKNFKYDIQLEEWTEDKGFIVVERLATTKVMTLDQAKKIYKALFDITQREPHAD